MLLVLFVHDDRSAEEQREGGLLGAVPLQHDPRWVLISTDVCPPSDALTRATRYALRSFASLAAPGLSRVDQALCPPAEGPAVGTDLDARSVAILSLAVSLALPLARSLARRYLPPDVWWGEQAVLRLSMGNFLLFVTLAVVMSFPAPVLTRDDWRDAKLHHGGYRSRPTCARSSRAPTLSLSLSLALRATCYALRSLARQEATS